MAQKIFASLAGFLILLAALTPALAVKTNDLELGHLSVYDNQVHIQRNASGQMTFQDSDLTSPVLLSDLNKGVSAHGALTGLSGDDHGQYHTDARHLSAHTTAFNSSLTIPVDIGGNATLGDHVTDNNIHLPRDEMVEILGNWRFSGTPGIWGGLDFSNAGVAGDVELNFENGAEDAKILWDESEERFDLNRGLRIDSALDVTGDATIDGIIYGDLAGAQNKTEHLYLGMDDSAASPEVLDFTGHFNQTFLDPSGDPNTDAHTTASLDGTTTGTMGSAFEFDGMNDRILLSDASHKPVLAKGHDFTIAMWWKTNSPATSSKRILSNNGALNSESYFEITTNGGNLTCSFKFYTGSFRTVYHTWTGGVDDAWHHYAITRKGTILSIYRDGQIEKLDDNPENTLSLASSVGLSIASIPSGSYNSPGLADDLRIYGAALSEGEIAALYSSANGTVSRARNVTEIDGALSIDRLAIDGGFTVSTATLQVGEGAYTDGNTWVNVSARDRKTNITAASPSAEWAKLDAIEVVEFAYKKRNPQRGQWLDPSGEPVAQDSSTHRQLTKGNEALLLQGYHQDMRKHLNEPENRRQLGFVAEDLAQVDPRLSRGHGVAAIDVAAFNTAVLKEMKTRILELEARLKQLE